jgi:hypothetical protein
VQPRPAPTPGRRRPPVLFANRFELAAFWACVAGLVIVVALLTVRFVAPRVLAPPRGELEARITAQERELHELRVELEATRARLDSLRSR